MSATVNKALSLLGLFTGERPEVGLSEVARLSGLDKATVYRLLESLTTSGLLEQDTQTKHYRLGPRVLQLARLREAAFPVISIVRPILEQLSQRTGETAHFSLMSGSMLTTIDSVESRKSSRVSLRDAEALPLHATASGLTVLAYSDGAVMTGALVGRLKRFTPHTETDRGAIAQMLADIRHQGFAVADQSYELDVYGVAAPVYGRDDRVIGAIAVATPCHRLDPDLKSTIVKAVIASAVETTRKLGTEPPASYLQASSRRAA